MRNVWDEKANPYRRAGVVPGTRYVSTLHIIHFGGRYSGEIYAGSVLFNRPELGTCRSTTSPMLPVSWAPLSLSGLVKLVRKQMVVRSRVTTAALVVTLVQLLSPLRHDVKIP